MKAGKETLQYMIDCINGNTGRNFKLYKNSNGYFVMEDNRSVYDGLTSGECKALLQGLSYALISK